MSDPTRTYAVAEIFDTLQGEGLRAGSRSVFVRLAGCNLWDGRPEHRGRGAGACALWCDTDFAEPRLGKLTAAEIVARVDALWPVEATQKRWVVLTGGEPLLQFDAELASAFERANVWLAVETNGTVALDDALRKQVDHLTVSPKLHADGSPPRFVQFEGDELKVVLPGHDDPERGWTPEALAALRRAGRWGSLFVQPEDSIAPGRYEGALSACIAQVRRDPRWRLSIQQHKLVGLP